MERIIELLNEKNHYLEKFYDLNEKEIIRFTQDNFDNLDHFYQTREKILEIMKYLDSEINREQALKTEDRAVSDSEKSMIREALFIKDEYVSRIVEQDLEILSCIEAAKNEIIRELQDVRKNKKALSSYKSPVFEQRLDEEV